MENLPKTTYLILRKPAFLNTLLIYLENFFKFMYQLFKKRAFILHFGDRTYKLFTPRGIPSKHAEMKGNRNAQSAAFWQEDIIKIKNNLLHFSMPKGTPVNLEDCQKAEEFIEKKLQASLTYPRNQISKSYDFSYIRELEKFGLDHGITAKVEQILNNVLLPITSGHGDLHAGNMIYLNDEIKIIDWSMFSHTASFITDYIHFYNYRLAKKTNQSWSTAILKNEPYLVKLSDCCGVNANHLRLAYSLRRISGEISQRRTLHDVLPAQIKKYNNILKYLIDEC